MTEDGLEVKSEDSQKFNGIRATLEVTGGKYMFEVPVGRERKKLYELSKYPQSNAKATIRNAFEC